MIRLGRVIAMPAAQRILTPSFKRGTLRVVATFAALLVSSSSQATEIIWTGADDGSQHTVVVHGQPFTFNYPLTNLWSAQQQINGDGADLQRTRRRSDGLAQELPSRRFHLGPPLSVSEPEQELLRL